VSRCGRDAGKIVGLDAFDDQSPVGELPVVFVKPGCIGKELEEN
jgi:hypothetical protein